MRTKNRCVVQFLGLTDPATSLVPLPQLAVRVLGYFPSLQHIGYSAGIVQGCLIIGGSRFNNLGFHLAGVNRAVHALSGRSLLRDRDGVSWRERETLRFVPREQVQHVFYDKSQIQRQLLLRQLGRPLEVDYDIDQAMRLMRTRLVLDAGHADVCDFVLTSLDLLHSHPLTAPLCLPPVYAVVGPDQEPILQSAALAGAQLKPAVLADGRLSVRLDELDHVPQQARVYVELDLYGQPQVVTVGRNGAGLIGREGRCIAYDLYSCRYRRDAFRRLEQASGPVEPLTAMVPLITTATTTAPEPATPPAPAELVA